jgi:Fe-S-cluster containining protein
MADSCRVGKNEYRVEGNQVFAKARDLHGKDLWYEVQPGQLLIKEDGDTSIKLLEFYAGGFFVTTEELQWLSKTMGFKLIDEVEAVEELKKQGQHCVQCGRCCQVYGHHLDLTPEDVARWTTEGRKDILRYVDKGMPEEGWMNPRTGEPFVSGRCPFLKKNKTGLSCRINATKPEVCRNFPCGITQLSYTRCKGFNWKPILKDYPFSHACPDIKED